VARTPYSLTARAGSQVMRAGFPDLESALERLEAWVQEQSERARRDPVDLGYRRFEPIQQVAARIEVSGPGGLRGGVDVRGDGSTEAYTGSWRRRLVEQRPGEGPGAALARALGA
jgi:hypothetical protein